MNALRAWLIARLFSFTGIEILACKLRQKELTFEFISSIRPDMDFSKWTDQELRVEFKTAIQNYIYLIRLAKQEDIWAQKPPVEINEYIASILEELKRRRHE